MGLRFRKSISIIPGVKLNFGKTGMSVSTGVPGFRKTFHTSGRVTTSVGIPGTGLYYVDTKNIKTQKNKTSAQSRREASTYYPTSTFETEKQNTNYTTVDNNESVSSTPNSNTTKQLDINSLKSIHKSSDDSIDWTEILVSPVPPDESYNQQMWSYYHSVASKVLAGDIDTYLQIIYEVNPLDDLLMYGGNYEFGTDDSKKIEVEFDVNIDALDEA